MAPLSWLLFVYSLPAKKSAARLALWRQLKRLGAVALKTSAYLLPATAEHEESFQWLAQKLKTDGGDATLIKVAEISGMSDQSVIDLFQEVRRAEYEELYAGLTAFAKPAKKRKAGSRSLPAELMSRFQAIRGVDFFSCPAASKVQQLVDRLVLHAQPGKLGRLSPSAYQARVWQTRPRPVIDRIGSAWLIARFIDRSPRFVFSSDPAAYPEALRFDMPGAHFGHAGDACTFETICTRFNLFRTAGLRELAEAVHDADLHDSKFGRPEATGLLRTFRGWAALEWSDQRMLEQGFLCFDGLHRSFVAGK